PPVSTDTGPIPGEPDAGRVDGGEQPLPDAGEPPSSDGGEPLPDAAEPPPSDAVHFNLVIRQTEQACSGCGIWFDPQGDPTQRPRLVVRYRDGGEERTLEWQRGLERPLYAYYISNEGTSRAEREDTLLMKRSPQRTGLLFADLSPIPAGAEILEARLHAHIHTHEGLANSDRSSVLTVYEGTREWDFATVDWNHYAAGARWTTPGGDGGGVVREIHAGRDMQDRGFSKASPNAHFDFTAHVTALQAAR
ncbi:MAG TPA: DNRLRE domain-containing protein, partial [Polyangiaceae bacterium LLY-WYZ-15_(1-7)]|nr:DNRLRE domain-containing protein [Polyangiaceae bacterium LLY-WYZ-15_(1-7)]